MLYKVHKNFKRTLDILKRSPLPLHCRSNEGRLERRCHLPSPSEWSQWLSVKHSCQPTLPLFVRIENVVMVRISRMNALFPISFPFTCVDPCVFNPGWMNSHSHILVYLASWNSVETKGHAQQAGFFPHHFSKCALFNLRPLQKANSLKLLTLT